MEEGKGKVISKAGGLGGVETSLGPKGLKRKEPTSWEEGAKQSKDYTEIGLSIKRKKGDKTYVEA